MKTTSVFCSLIFGSLFILMFGCKNEPPKVLPTLAASIVTNVTASSASSGGTVSSDGGDPVTARGVCWSSANATPTTSDNKTTDGTGIGTFTSLLTGLTQATTYNLRAYASNGVGTAYSNASSFTTLALAPVLSTTDITSLTATSLISGGNVTADGGSPVTARGVCWSVNQNPTIADSKTTDGTGTAVFISLVSGLSPGVTYYLRAYATNSIGTAYGNQVSTRTLAVLPVLTTTMASSVTASTASAGGNISSDGGGVITFRGVCWGTTSGPTISGSKSTDGTGAGSFTSSITGLSPLTTYYLRAYATNGAGTAYGNEISFKTLANLPTLTTTIATSITFSSATSGGTITSDGGANVTSRGVCWSTSQSPTTSDNRTTEATGNGNFTSSVAGLAPFTTYYLRAYATNSTGTAYGNEISFRTLATIPSVITAEASSITHLSARSGGNILTDNGDAVTARGICWSIHPNPTTSDLKTTDGTGSGIFISSLTGLLPLTTYFIRAYAINGIGIGYGNLATFTTPEVADGDGNFYSTVTIGSQVWLASNLKTTKFNDGTQIPLVTDNSAWNKLTTSAYCWYNNDLSNKATYGALYIWYTVITGKLCPIGWHVPSDGEWTVLTDFLGGETVAGGKLKEAGFSHWNAGSGGATNETGFTALPGGNRYTDGTFGFMGTHGYWWSTTEGNLPYTAYYRYMYYDYSNANRHDTDRQDGFSVRCLKD